MASHCKFVILYVCIAVVGLCAAVVVGRMFVVVVCCRALAPRSFLGGWAPPWQGAGVCVCVCCCHLIVSFRPCLLLLLAVAVVAVASLSLSVCLLFVCVFGPSSSIYPCHW